MCSYSIQLANTTHKTHHTCWTIKILLPLFLQTVALTQRTCKWILVPYYGLELKVKSLSTWPQMIQQETTPKKSTLLWNSLKGCQEKSDSQVASSPYILKRLTALHVHALKIGNQAMSFPEYLSARDLEKNPSLNNNSAGIFHFTAYFDPRVFHQVLFLYQI